MEDSSSFDILLVGFDEHLLSVVKPLLGSLKFKTLNKADEVEVFIESYQLKPGSSVIVSNFLEGISHYEIGQAFGSSFSAIQIVFLTQDRNVFNLAELKKNGFSDSYLLPIDLQILTSFIDACKVNGVGSAVKKYKAVKLLDIQSGEHLPFEVRAYLPMNNKYVVLTADGELSEKKHKLLKSKDAGSVFVDTNQIEKFYDFVAEKLVSLGKSSNDAVSATEKAQRLRDSVRTLFKSVLTTSTADTSFESGRELLDQSKKVVESYVQKTTGLDLKGKLKSVLGDASDAYSHAQSVSTIACLFSMATGIGQPEDLAIAGLFHDIGIQGLARDVSIFDFKTLGEVDRKKYEQHPRLSLSYLKEKKITLAPIISDIIEKHHERLDGKGFPAQLPAHKVPMEAQLLAYADAFEYLSRPAAGKAKLQPLEMHKIISNELSVSPELLIKMENFLKDS